MTGCPYSLIYSAADTLDELRRSGRVSYYPDLLAVALKEEDGRPSVTATNLRTSAQHQFSAERVFVACGAIGTTRLVLNSLRRYGEDVELQESAQFIVRSCRAIQRRIPAESRTTPWVSFARCSICQR